MDNEQVPKKKPPYKPSKDIPLKQEEDNEPFIHDDPDTKNPLKIEDPGQKEAYQIEDPPPGRD